MADLAAIGLSIVMVLGPVIGYVDQYFIIKKKQSSAGFNSLTCAILLFSNILRVFFWSVESVQPNALQLTPFVGLESNFWAWSHYLSYLNCILCFTTIVGVLYILCHSYTTFIEAIGVISLGIESTLPLPQCISNWKRRSTYGFSLLVIGSWILGDSFKVFYFIHTDAPVQFDICGSIQVAIDSFIVFEFIIFSAKVKKWLGISSPLLIDDEAGDDAYEPILE
ncbi:PQ loop repeat-domain-containing protein [Phycomyces nitens]|nr:PQ loop repeat-domain-containing protein [Phycomyces nitens]